MRTTRSLAAQALARTRTQDEGQTLIEYVLVTGLVSVTLVATLGALAGGLGQLFETIVAQF